MRCITFSDHKAALPIYKGMTVCMHHLQLDEKQSGLHTVHALSQAMLCITCITRTVTNSCDTLTQTNPDCFTDAASV